MLTDARTPFLGTSSVPPKARGLGNLLKTHRDGDLQLLICSEELLVGASHQVLGARAAAAEQHRAGKDLLGGFAASARRASY